MYTAVGELATSLRKSMTILGK